MYPSRESYEAMGAIAIPLLGAGRICPSCQSTHLRAALRIIKFYQHESCGWCIPCREGTAWLRKLLIRFHEGFGTRNDITLCPVCKQGKMELVKTLICHHGCLVDAAQLHNRGSPKIKRKYAIPEKST